MNLIIDNVKYDSDIEREFLAPDGFCFNIELKYSKDFHIPFYSKTIEKYTEIHNRFRNYVDFPEIAFESDILQTGFTRKLWQIDSVTVTTVTI